VMKAIECTTGDMSTSQKLRIFFGTSDRHVGCWKVIADFRLPGKLYDSHTGQFYRQKDQADIKTDFQFWIRFDDEKPEIVEMESDELNEVFTLTRDEWAGIKGNLKYVG
jgi:hypothetical protein